MESIVRRARGLRGDAGQRSAQGSARKKRLEPAARREAVTRLIERYRMSRVRACRLVGLNRSSLNYQSQRPDDSTVRQRLRELTAERRRFGYRRLGWLLAREGHVMNRKKLYRIYRAEKLMVR